MDGHMRGRLPNTPSEYLQAYQHSAVLRYWRLYDTLGLFSFWQIIPDIQEASRPVLALSPKRDPDVIPHVFTQTSGSFKRLLDAHASWRQDHLHERETSKEDEATNSKEASDEQGEPLTVPGLPSVR
jgi:hypothetical protein